ADHCRRGREGQRGVARPGPGRTRLIVGMEAGGAEVDGRVVRAPGAVLHVERLAAHAVDVEFGGVPAGDDAGRSGDVEDESLLPGLPADRSEVTFDQDLMAAVA